MEYYRVVYNTTYGGFFLPHEIVRQFKQKYDEELQSQYSCDRTDERIIKLIETSEWFKDSDFAIKEIPKGCNHEIHEYDGKEWVSWTLPEIKIIDDLRMLLLGEITDENVNPITKQFLEFGGKFKDFDVWFRKKFNDRKTDLCVSSDYE